LSRLAPSDGRAGFTLVELLVSMAVLSLVALTMAAGLRFVVQATASTDSRREGLEELTLGLSVLRGELERAEPLMVKVGDRDLVMFSGTADRLRFANVEPAYLAGPPYLAYEYAVTLDQGSYRIDLRRAPIDPDQPDLRAVEAAEPRTLLRVTRPLSFTYWGRLRPRDAPAWHEEWPPGPRLPEAIRLAEGEDPGWPDLVVPVRITAPWYCGGGGEGGSGGGGEVGAIGADEPGAVPQEASGAAGKAGCPGTGNPGERDLLTPSTATQTPFGQAGGDGSGLGRRTPR
jgi:prepilin-type N-terminal cleavage/methylation domain-containing protein